MIWLGCASDRQDVQNVSHAHPCHPERSKDLTERSDTGRVAGVSRSDAIEFSVGKDLAGSGGGHLRALPDLLEGNTVALARGKGSQRGHTV